jgi:hypothetical protein
VSGFRRRCDVAEDQARTAIIRLDPRSVAEMAEDAQEILSARASSLRREASILRNIRLGYDSQARAASASAQVRTRVLVLSRMNQYVGV